MKSYISRKLPTETRITAPIFEGLAICFVQQNTTLSCGIPPRPGKSHHATAPPCGPVYTDLLGMRNLAGLLLLPALAGIPAFAQADLAGNWAPLYHEDFPERIPGPELGDYMGIPINDAARLRGDSYDADRISVVGE